MSVSGASTATCARSLYENFLCKLSVSGSPQQDPVGALAHRILGALVQDRFARISCPTSLSGSLHQDPVIPLAQDLCLRISCARSPWHDVCIRILQDLCLRISCARSFCQGVCIRILWASCARSLYEDLLCKLPVSRSPQ